MKNKNIYSIIGSIIVATGLIIFGLYSTKCQGAECKVEDISINKKTESFVMDPVSINSMVEKNQIVLLDVREDSEWNEGHIKGALHIPQGDLNIEKTKDLPKDIPIYIYCRSGRRAIEAETKLKELNFNNTKVLGGIIEWQEKGGTLIID